MFKLQKSYNLWCWNRKGALATDSNCSGTRKAMATDSIALEWSLQPEKRFGHRLKLLSSGLWNSKFVLAAERVYAMALSCAFV